MDRPYWLDVVRVTVFLSPPVFLAAVLTSLATWRFSWSLWEGGGVYVAMAVASIAAWITLAVTWGRRC